MEIELPQVIRSERRYLTEDEVALLVDVMPARYKALVVVASYLGLRWQELAGLRRDAVIMKPGEVPALRVISTVERSNGKYSGREYGKSAAARRSLKMPGWTAKYLSWDLTEFAHDEWAFPSPRAASCATTTSATAYGRKPPKSGASRRSTFMSCGNRRRIHDRRGGERPAGQAAHGTRGHRTTFNIYGHLFDDDEDALVTRLDRRARDAAGRLGASGVRDLLGVDDADVIELTGKKAKRPCDQELLLVDQSGFDRRPHPCEGC
ncbi:MAG: hypothetical protein M3198_11135 [Actinomycetota bacterium]|nr:hypothetical protein [Actinomycetota bacterium]